MKCYLELIKIIKKLKKRLKMETINFRGYSFEIENQDENYYDCKITEEIAGKIKDENPAEYLQWENGEEITATELENFFIHIPKDGTPDEVSISYILQDFWIEDIVFENK